jgi:hypothetical protein
MGALAQVYDMVRNDAAEVEARANEVEVRKGLVQHLCDQVAAMQERINTLADALEARHKADAEREEQERQFEEEPISEPPGTGTEREAQEPPEIVTDLEVGSHVPGGELHDIPPKDESDLPEPPLGAEDDGALPEELAKYAGLDEPPEPPKGKVYSQPIAISLNKE